MSSFYDRQTKKIRNSSDTQSVILTLMKGKIDRNTGFLTFHLDTRSEFTFPSDLIHFIAILTSQNTVTSRSAESQISTFEGVI
jgi:hypothetical protein